MTAPRGVVHPEVAAIVTALGPHLGHALRGVTERPAGLVVVAAGRAADDVAELVGALRVSAAGHHYAAAPLGRVRALAGQLAPTVADALGEPLPLGETWCVVLGPDGAAAVPILWPTARGGSA